MTTPWQDDALCAQIGGDLWFPDKGESPARAKRICRDCPVRLPCEEAGRYEPHGVWAGMTYRERLALRPTEAAA